MKIAITSSGTELNSPLDPRFGRAAKFIMYDTETKSLQVIDNAQNLNAAQGAGIQSAQNVIRAGAEAVITGHCGPKAYRVLKEGGVPIYNSDTKTVAEALELFTAGKLAMAAGADVEGHWV
jgi:predicted Fe-Mo cluster-binding NifX family protein